MGSFGGFLWHFGKGLCNAPKGERFATGFYTARSRAPALGGKISVSCIFLVDLVFLA